MPLWASLQVRNQTVTVSEDQPNKIIEEQIKALAKKNFDKVGNILKVLKENLHCQPYYLDFNQGLKGTAYRRPLPNTKYCIQHTEYHLLLKKAF